MLVSVQSAWFSKINWTQAIAFLSMLFTMFGHTIPPDVQASVVAAIVAISAVATWVLRTFFTATVTPAVAAKL